MLSRDACLSKEILVRLGFKCDGGVWLHTQEERFAIKLEPTCFYVAFHGYQAKYPYALTVESLEKQFFERTGKLLF